MILAALSCLCTEWLQMFNDWEWFCWSSWIPSRRCAWSVSLSWHLCTMNRSHQSFPSDSSNFDYLAIVSWPILLVESVLMVPGLSLGWSLKGQWRHLRAISSINNRSLPFWLTFFWSSWQNSFHASHESWPVGDSNFQCSRSPIHSHSWVHLGHGSPTWSAYLWALWQLACLGVALDKCAWESSLPGHEIIRSVFSQVLRQW